MTGTRAHAQTLSARVVRATLLVATLTAVSLAGTAAALALVVWQAREAARVQESADALANAIRSEDREERHGLTRAAQDAVRESAVTSYRVEVWRGDTLVTGNLPGARLGPPGRPRDPSAWIATSVAIEPDLTLLVAAPREHGLRSLRVFLLSLAVALPICLLLAWRVGRTVAAKATRPLEDFRARILAARPAGPFPAPSQSDAPAEIRDLDDAFGQLWDRLDAALARERDFAANASHELRTPLTRLRLHVERAAHVTGAESTVEWNHASREVDRMVRLVNSLLVLARDVSTGVPREVVNLADLARAAAHEIFPEPGAAVLTSPDEAMVRGDEDLLSTALTNLLDNARKFTLSGALVTADLCLVAGLVRFRVTSPGARVAPEERELVFERFYRGAEARATANGHGLGLPLCRHIARLHGGDARCVSAADEDACFVLELPAWAPQRLD